MAKLLIPTGYSHLLFRSRNGGSGCHIPLTNKTFLPLFIKRNHSISWLPGVAAVTIKGTPAATIFTAHMKQAPIILFDGICNLCNSAVQFVINHDPGQKFLFASLQSEFGQQLLQQYQLPSQQFDSFILLQGERIYTKSTAALTVAKQIKGAWKFLYIFMVLPRFLRDGIYNWIARNRYRWFGKKENCMVPTPQLKARFLS